MIQSLNSWFLLFFHYILLGHFLLQQILVTTNTLLINESIKDLEIKTSILFDLDFADKTISSG